MRPPSRRQRLAHAATLAITLAAASTASAQQHTFHLDRLEVPGSPDDGLVLFRPVTREQTIFYAQLALGFSLDPLRTRNITSDSSVLGHSSTNVVSSQLSTYMSAGIELFDRATFGATLPVAWEQAGNQPVYPSGLFGGSAFTAFSTTGPAAGDLRLDGRYVAWRSADRSEAVGVQLSLFAPTGTATNFGGDGSLAAMPMVTGEWTPAHFPIRGLEPTFVGNLGLDFRPDNSINDPAGHFGAAQGLGVGDEIRWAVGFLLPAHLFKRDMRLGLTVFGQTGVTSDSTTGPTFFTKQNTPIEWDAEARMKLPVMGWDHWFVGAGTGTRILGGYGAPDFRFVALLGSYWEIKDTTPAEPDRVRMTIVQSPRDTDGDGIPDDIDACPTVPEDHKEPDPSDGCPAISDRDGDGIPDDEDACPDQAGVRTTDPKTNGCPADTDGDGIPDAKDACPKEPGQPDPDPKKNGCPKFIHLEESSIRTLQQVHFETGSATILPDSFPMLTEIAQLLKATPSIKRMRIEGHTDNRGAADMNMDLSKRRAASVRAWLVQHGVGDSRLESQGYGLTQPIETNDTVEGRAANRRVEFKIVQEDGATPAGKPSDKDKQE
jgi:outer membrane protein OmpA-like peptidoglycan-associated protein